MGDVPEGPSRRRDWMAGPQEAESRICEPSHAATPERRASWGMPAPEGGFPRARTRKFK